MVLQVVLQKRPQWAHSGNFRVFHGRHGEVQVVSGFLCGMLFSRDMWNVWWILRCLGSCNLKVTGFTLWRILYGPMNLAFSLLLPCKLFMSHVESQTLSRLKRGCFFFSFVSLISMPVSCLSDVLMGSLPDLFTPLKPFFNCRNINGCGIPMVQRWLVAYGALKLS